MFPCRGDTLACARVGARPDGIIAAKVQIEARCRPPSHLLLLRQSPLIARAARDELPSCLRRLDAAGRWETRSGRNARERWKRLGRAPRREKAY